MKRTTLTEIRKSFGSRPFVAKQLGISTIHLRKLESGDVNPSAGLMLRMSEFFGKRPEELFPDLQLTEQPSQAIF